MNSKWTANGEFPHQQHWRPQAKSTSGVAVYPTPTPSCPKPPLPNPPRPVSLYRIKRNARLQTPGCRSVVAEGGAYKWSHEIPESEPLRDSVGFGRPTGPSQIKTISGQPFWPSTRRGRWSGNSPFAIHLLFICYSFANSICYSFGLGNSHLLIHLA